MTKHLGPGPPSGQHLGAMKGGSVWQEGRGWGRREGVHATRSHPPTLPPSSPRHSLSPRLLRPHSALLCPITEPQVLTQVLLSTVVDPPTLEAGP